MDKRALSNLVAYVLLISITLSLSVLVYAWLKFYVAGDDVVACPENVNVIINGYTCTPGAGGSLNVTLKNKGLFDIDGYVLRVHDRADAEFGFYVFDDEGFPLRPGDSVSVEYDFSDSDVNPSGITDVTFVDVQPYVLEDGKISCEAYASQRVICS